MPKALQQYLRGIVNDHDIAERHIAKLEPVGKPKTVGLLEGRIPALGLRS
jgi:hypothetical protein